MEPVIRMNGIKKIFPGVVALDDISFDLFPGEVHVLIGENGAGKSTLMKILSGVCQPTVGTIQVMGRTYSSLTPKQSKNLGIGIIFQELSLIDSLSVAENLFVGKLPVKTILGLPVVDKRGMEERALGILERVGLKLDPRTCVSDLAISQKQLVEIAKALASDARVIIMDEPTSSLNTREVETLFSIIRTLKANGVSIVYISHKLDELRRIGDRITILKDGRTVATRRAEEYGSNAEIVSLMVGRELGERCFNGGLSRVGEEVLFRAEGVTRSDGRVKDVSFVLRRGEILGFAGLVGAGRTELMEALFGASPVSVSGCICLNGRNIEMRSPYHSIKSGIGMITENRRQSGFMPNFEILRNIVLPLGVRRSRLGGLYGLIEKKGERRTALGYSEKMRVKCTSVDQMVFNLSGGNQQKVIIAKWLAADSELLIFDEPTRGIDVGAKSEIYRIMRDLANEGRGILMVSSELPELIAVCDRILLFGEGRIKEEFHSEDVSEEKIMMAATGR